jgi:asparagine synthase (glutamine-hydrolysing)
MCGIAGFVLADGERVGDPLAALRAMARAMVHRGPDDEGIHLAADGRVGLANRRLAIRDRSPAGHMPMASADGRVLITYNGEIYNAAAVRAELEALGGPFRSSGDTEVILRGYEAWGPEVVRRLRGMFAFAIYDAREGPGRRCLLLARDRLGIKPLYHAASPGRLVFASELGALRASGLVSRATSPAGLVGYLLFGAVPGPLTIHQDVRALPPASIATVPVSDGVPAPASRRYWTLPTDTDGPADPAAAARAVRAGLEDAVRCHLVSDAPLGAFLSGGLDSSAVVALARAGSPGPIRTCSMSFEETEYSEAPYARSVARALGTEHFERTVTGAEVAGELDRVFRAMDQPTVDGVNTYLVARTAREAGLTVALSGLGGDELFGGYPSTFVAVPRLVRAVRLSRRVPGGAMLVGAGLRAHPGRLRWAKAADALARPPSLASAYLACRGVFAPSQVRALVSPDVWAEARAALDPLRWIEEAAGNGRSEPFSWVARAELGTYTCQQLLRDTDVMGMAHSLEVRVPLLDHELVEKVLRLPTAAKRDGAPPKPLLRRAVADLLPPAVLARPDKQGFVLPFERWLRGSLREAARARLDDLAGLLQPDAVRAVWRAWEGGRLHWSRPWALAALGGWRAAAGAGTP